jgi:hypothetical protein
MGKQVDAFRMIRAAFDNYPDLEALDLDAHPTDTERLRVSFYGLKQKLLDEARTLDFENRLFEVYSGSKQIEKLLTQRFTRDDF